MKIYTFSVQAAEHGETYAFTSMAKAKAAHRAKVREMKADQDRHKAKGASMFIGVEQVFDIAMQEFPISAAGIIAAYEAGSYDVPK